MDVFDKLRFVNKVATQLLSQVGEEVRSHRYQDTGAVIDHGENQTPNHRSGSSGEFRMAVQKLKPRTTFPKGPGLTIQASATVGPRTARGLRNHKRLA